MQCYLIFGFLKCAIPEDRMNVSLKVCIVKGIHTFKKDYKSQISKCSQWGAEVQTYPALRKKMTQFMHRTQAATTPYANNTYQPKLQKNPRKRNLVQRTSKPNKSNLVRLRKVNYRKFLSWRKENSPCPPSVIQGISHTGNQNQERISPKKL